MTQVPQEIALPILVQHRSNKNNKTTKIIHIKTLPVTRYKLIKWSMNELDLINKQTKN